MIVEDMLRDVDRVENGPGPHGVRFFLNQKNR